MGSNVTTQEICLKEKTDRKWSFGKYHTYRIGVLVVKNLSANDGDIGDARVEGLIPGSGRSPGGGNGNHSSILAWGIPGTEEPGGLQSMEHTKSWTCEHACMLI